MDTFVRDILDGSANIDRMEREVNRFVHLFLSCAATMVTKPETLDGTRFEFTGGYWELVVGRGQLEARCVIHKGINAEYQSWGDAKFPHRIVQEVYEALKILKDGVLKTLPGLDKRLEVIRRAARVRF